MRCVLESPDDGLLDCEFLYRVGRIGGQSQLSQLRGVPLLGVRVMVVMVVPCGRVVALLRAQFVVALDDHSSKLKEVLVRRVNVEVQPGPSRVIDT